MALPKSSVDAEDAQHCSQDTEMASASQACSVIQACSQLSQHCSQDTEMVSASQVCSQLSQPCSQDLLSSQSFSRLGAEPEEEWCASLEEAVAKSTPVLQPRPRCFLPDTRVMALGDGPVEASHGLYEGCVVRSNRVRATVTQREEHPVAKITVVQVTVADDERTGSVTVTAPHRFLVQRKRRWAPVAAEALQPGDELRGLSGQVLKVVSSTVREDERGLVQAWLSDPGATMFVADPGSELFVEVYGTEPPPPEPEVEIVRFSTSTGLRKQLEEAPQLLPRLEALEQAGITTALQKYDYGYGIFLVAPALAGKSLVALGERKRRRKEQTNNGGRLLSSEVVVSRDLKEQVIAIAQQAYVATGQTGRGSGKHRYVKHQFCEALELDEVPAEALGSLPTKRAKVGPGDGDSIVTASTTAARGDRVRQPRLYGR